MTYEVMRNHINWGFKDDVEKKIYQACLQGSRSIVVRGKDNREKMRDLVTHFRNKGYVVEETIGRNIKIRW